MSESHSSCAVEYRPIAGFPGNRVGSDGSVWSCLSRRKGRGVGRNSYFIGDEWRRLKHSYTQDGYEQVVLQINKTARYARVAILVLETFVGPRPYGMQCCHKDGSRTNNAIDNLRWGTPQDNTDDKRRHGTILRCEDHPGSKLTRDVVIEMRRRYDAGGITYADLGKQFGIAQGSAWRIVKRIAWSDVE